MTVKAAVDLRLIARADRVWASVASIWAVLETGTALEAVYKEI